jgi:cytoskeleton protein RodZ
MIGRRQPPKAPEQDAPRSFDDFEMKLGDMMRGERATLGKSLLDVQRDLKIKAGYIAAIENADVSAFETQGFIAGYVRSYARYLNMDPEWAFDNFCLEAKFTTVNGLEREKAQPSKAFQRGNSKRAKSDPRDSIFETSVAFAPKGESVLARIEPGAVGSSLVLLALVSAIGYGGWAVLREIQQVQVTPVDQAPGVVAQVEPLGLGGGFGTNEPFSAGVDVAPRSTDALRLYRPEALEVPVMVARDGPIAALDPQNVGSLANFDNALIAPTDRLALAGTATDPSVATPFFENSPRVLTEDAPEVMLVAVRAAWVRVRAADGSILLEKTLQPGEAYTLPATEEPANLRAGAAGGVFFMVNGQTYGPAGASGSVVADISLGSSDLTQTFALVDETNSADAREAVRFAEAALIEQLQQDDQ